MEKTSIVWFRQDLRLTDNPALERAIRAGRPIVPVYIFAPDEEGGWAPGGAARWWLHHALGDLQEQLLQRGLRLVIRKAPPSTLDALGALAQEANAEAVFWNRRYEPAAIVRDAAIKEALKAQGLEVASANSALLVEPRDVQNKAGKSFKVFTAFWRHFQTLKIDAPLEVSLLDLKTPDHWPRSEELEALELLPKTPWDDGLRASWDPTRAAAWKQLLGFVREGKAAAYPDQRDRPDRDATSRLSPFLHCGQLGPREVWAALAGAPEFGDAIESGIMRQLVWREFAYHLLYHCPETPTEPLRKEFQLFPWEPEERVLHAWQTGRTGYPIVDAGMRELWETGWMHNRVRMIVASVLVKHLLQHWMDGAQWFWDTLVDADLANNTFSWQWTAGCGADAAPYFRIFSPILQGKKFDPNGVYVRRYVPELTALPTRYIHEPWAAPEEVLEEACIIPGRTYPMPIVSHADGRARALAAFEALKARKAEEGGG